MKQADALRHIADCCCPRERIIALVAADVVEELAEAVVLLRERLNDYFPHNEEDKRALEAGWRALKNAGEITDE